jgi:uncharacterized membrane protein HdeD (DUF308 family)
MESSLFRSSNVLPTGLEEVHKHWFWYLALGVFMTFLGALAIAWSFATTIVSMAFLGWLLLIGGVVEVGHAFWKRKWSGFFLDLLAGILYGGIGFLVLANPGLTALALTFGIAVLLLFGGLFRIVAALALDPPHGSWVILSGAISMMLGLMIWQQWPFSGLWAIGLFIGVDLVFNGVALMMLSFTARKNTTTGSAY